MKHEVTPRRQRTRPQSYQKSRKSDEGCNVSMSGNKATKKIIETHSAEETFELGRRIGRQARAGEVYTLTGDLGVGKTVLTQESLPGWT